MRSLPAGYGIFYPPPNLKAPRRNRPLSEVQTKRNRYLSKTRYVVEQSFGTLHRKFRYARAAY
ncbi:transposase family protein, partial [Neisseria meningitidis]|uniref:transposase family protein n=1 Tax=Neisseria meningitidis TaxID=487 RepID=UPI002181E907